MSIGELTQHTGIPASTIRYWERAGVLPHPARLNGRRRYTAEVIDLIAALQLAQACGLRLSEMRQLLHGFSTDVGPRQRWQELARTKCVEIDEQLERLTNMRELLGRVTQCRCSAVRDCGRIAAAIIATVEA